MALPIYVPIAYILVLLVSLSTFSRIYRRRSASRVAGGVNAQPWFPEGHPERDVYMSLVAAAASSSDGEEESEGEGEKGQVQKKEGNDKISDTVLKAALLNRAMADVRRIIRMRDDKQALSALLQKGSLGDETMERFALAEKELEAEILDVVSEANTFKEGWGQIIFPTASEMVAHLKHKEAYYGIQAQRQEESECPLLLHSPSQRILTRLSLSQHKNSRKQGNQSRNRQSRCPRSSRPQARRSKYNKVHNPMAPLVLLPPSPPALR